jgi:hypothetical protein
MRKLLGFSGLLAMVVLALAASPASAGTTNVSVSMSFAEPVLQNIQSGCPAFFAVPNGGFCGNGSAVPFGHATEMILFGGACGGNCDFRTVNVAGGSIYIDETASNFQCPGACAKSRGNGFPFSATLTDVIVGGTGMFAGATGNLSGSVTGTNLMSAIKLAGTITLHT